MAEGFRYFTSADSGAPVLTGENGSLIAVMDWLITLPPDTATAGDNQWVKEFAGTHKGGYRAKKGNRLYLRMQDDGPTTQGAREAGVRMFETMSDVDTGSAPVPTDTQVTAIVQPWVWRKSNTASAVVRPYFGIITARSITLLLGAATGAGGVWYQYCAFGDWASALAAVDSYNTTLIGRRGVNTNDTTSTLAGPWAFNFCGSDFGNSPSSGWDRHPGFIWRTRAGANHGPLAYFNLMGAGTGSLSGDAGGCIIVPGILMQRGLAGDLGTDAVNRIPRLIAPFVYPIVNSVGSANDDTFSIGSRNFRVWRHGGNTMLAMEISNTDTVQP